MATAKKTSAKKPTARDKAIKAGLKRIDKQIADAKKKPSTVKTPSTAQSKAFDKAFEAWKKGEQISVLAAEIKCKRGALRRQLRRRAGGRTEFKALRNTGAGGIRASLGARAAKPSMDEHAKIIPVGGRSNWTHRIVRELHGKSLDRALVVHVAGTSGVEYVTAESGQKADVLVEMGNGLPPARLVKFVQFK